jgi:hypothetical protein
MDRASHSKPIARGNSSRRQDSPLGADPEMENRILRVILLEDGETVHNAFFDRNFKE